MASKRIRILYLIGGANRGIGGMEVHLLRLLGSLDEHYEPHVCCVNANDAYVAEIRAMDVPCTNLGLDRLGALPFGRALGKLAGVVRKTRPHIIQSYGFLCDVIAPLFRVVAPRVRVITTRRGENRNRRHQLAYRWTTGFCDSVVCVSESAARFAQSTQRVPQHMVRVIPNGVHVSAPFRRREGTCAVRFGTLGTVKPVKGTDLLVEAFLRFPANVDAELFIAGPVNREWAHALVDQARTSHLRDRIHFLGLQRDSSAFLRELDVFVLPSRSEGMSNALLEAMGHELPCIATDVGSNAEVLRAENGAIAGVICKPDADALFAAMQRMIGVGCARRQWGALARQIVSTRYSLEAMGTAYMRLYTRVAAAPLVRPGWARRSL